VCSPHTKKKNIVEEVCEWRVFAMNGLLAGIYLNQVRRFVCVETKLIVVGPGVEVARRRRR
jgi:hypothetical protein